MFAGDDLVAAHRADDGAGKVVLSIGVEARHLRGLAADQCAAVGPAGFTDALHHLLDDHVFQLAGREIVEEEERRRTLHGDVVDTVVYQVLAHGVVDAEFEGNLQLGPDAVGTGDQHGVRKFFQVQRKQAAEAANLGEHLPIESLACQHLDALLAAVSRGDVDACVGVTHALSACGRGRSGLRGLGRSWGSRDLLQAGGLLLGRGVTERRLGCGRRLWGGRIGRRGGLIRQGSAPCHVA